MALLPNHISKKYTGNTNLKFIVKITVIDLLNHSFDNLLSICYPAMKLISAKKVRQKDE